MENWKNISEKEEWVNKARLVTLFLINWETPILDIVLKFLNTLLIKAHIFILVIKIICI
jgi:hypothetical protein